MKKQKFKAKGIEPKRYYNKFLFAVLILAVTFFNFKISNPVLAYEKILIENCEELQLIGDSDYPLDGEYALENDIDCDGLDFQPIALMEGIERNPFEGVFDGNGYIIKNLSINMSQVKKVSLFSEVGSSGEILNVIVKDANIKGGEQTGGIVGYNSGTIKSSYVKEGLIEGSDYVGGVVATNWKGSITDSYSTAKVRGSNYVGGFVGWNDEGLVNRSYATGDVEGSTIIGGFAGFNEEGVIGRSYATGNVLNASERAGGFVGYNYLSSIKESYSTGSVFSTGDQVGGFVGYNNLSSIERSYAKGDVEGGYWAVGGFAGFNEGVIKNSHSGGAVNWQDEEDAPEGAVGGFVGYNNRETIKNSYATGYVGEISSGGDNVGGFIGYLDSGGIQNSFSTGYVFGEGDNVAMFAGSNDENIDNSFVYKFSDEKNCVSKEGSGASTECTSVEKIESFYKYDDQPLKELYDRWDFQLAWADNYLKEDYPVLRWRVEPEEVSGGVSSGSAAGQRPLPWYQNPLYSEQKEELLRGLEEMRAEVKTAQEGVNSLIDLFEQLDA